jgi:hypothetical protein
MLNFGHFCGELSTLLGASGLYKNATIILMGKGILRAQYSDVLSIRAG